LICFRNSYLQPFLKQSHIDPIREQNSKQIRATKHLYRPASADHVVRHLGSPLSRTQPYFVFAGKEFFQQTTNYSPLYQRAMYNSVSFII
jgi:hypothetical protein